MECELHAAAQTGAVDRCDGRKGQHAQAAEQPVPDACAFDSALAGDPGKLGDVGAGREEERLAGDDRRREVTTLELVQDPFERFERPLAEERRLRPVLAVVDRHQRDVARAGELEVSDRCQGSPTGEQRPFPCRRTAR